ncbi:MAG: hypothetical protein PSV35_00945, partial [bacterium]|nr:hypothetical protein [bacterium]
VKKMDELFKDSPRELQMYQQNSKTVKEELAKIGVNKTIPGEDFLKVMKKDLQEIKAQFKAEEAQAAAIAEAAPSNASHP